MPVNEPPSPAGDDVRRQLLDELASYAPSRQMHAMRHWPAGRLSLVHLNVLIVLSGDGALPMRGLAEALDVSQASATGIVDRMEQRGLVERLRDPDDRRIVRVSLTDAGRELIEGVADQRRELVAHLLAELTDDEVRSLLIGLRAIRRAREALHHRAPSTPPDHSEAPR